MPEGDTLQLVGRTIADKYAVESVVGEGGLRHRVPGDAPHLEAPRGAQGLQGPGRLRGEGPPAPARRVHPGGGPAGRPLRPHGRHRAGPRHRDARDGQGRPTSPTWSSSGSRAPRSRRSSHDEKAAGAAAAHRRRGRAPARSGGGGPGPRAPQGHRPPRRQARATSSSSATRAATPPSSCSTSESPRSSRTRRRCRAPSPRRAAR